MCSLIKEETSSINAPLKAYCEYSKHYFVIRSASPKTRLSMLSMVDENDGLILALCRRQLPENQAVDLPPRY